MKKLFLSLAFLLTGAVASQAAMITIYCEDGNTVDIEIPNKSEFPSLQRYNDYVNFLARAACGQGCDYRITYWEIMGDDDFRQL